jgi:hypothetical protein
VLIVLDTNVFRRDLMLRSTKSEILLDYARKTGARFLMPQIVEEELRALYGRELRKQWVATQEAQREISQLLFKEHVQEKEIETSGATERYMEFIRTNLRVIKPLGIVPYKDSYLPDLVSRAIHGRPPLAREKAQEFRDGILWLTLLDVAVAKKQKVVLISGNVKDFADSTGSLRPELADEAHSRDAEISFYSSVDEFLRAHADRISFVTIEWLKANLDLIELGSDLDSMLRTDERREVGRWAREQDRKFTELETVNVSRPRIQNYFIHEMTDGSLRIEIRVTADVEVEYLYVKDFDWRRMRDDRETAVTEITADYSVKVVGQEIDSIELEEWYLA